MSGSDLRTCRKDGSAGGGHGDGGLLGVGGGDMARGDDAFCDGEGCMLAVGGIGAAISGGTLLISLGGDLPGWHFLVVFEHSTVIERNLRQSFFRASMRKGQGRREYFSHVKTKHRAWVRDEFARDMELSPQV